MRQWQKATQQHPTVSAVWPQAHLGRPGAFDIMVLFNDYREV
jgi:hypothetical protein